MNPDREYRNLFGCSVVPVLVIDLDVYILSGGCDPNRCTEWGYYETYFAVHPCEQPYYIVIKGYEEDDSGPFTLEVKCHSK